MTDAFAAIVVAGVAFLATNVENLLLLIGLMAVTGARPWAVGTGYVLSVVVVVGLSLGLGMLLGMMESVPLRWLGLLPLGVGLFLGVYGIVRRKGVEVEEPTRSLAVVSSFGISLAHSVDSLAVYGPLFAETKGDERALMAGTIGLLSVVGVFGARYLTTHPVTGRVLKSVAPVAVPLLLIAVGVYILLDTPTDMAN